MIKNGDESAMNLMLEKYRLFSWSLAKEFQVEYSYLNIETEDYMSIAFASVPSALDKALKDDKIVFFYAYWSTIARNAIKHYIRDYLQKNKHLINNTVSLDDFINSSQGSTLHEFVGKEDDNDRQLIKETILNIVNDKKNDFPDIQKNILALIFEGYIIKEIGIILDIPESTLYSNYQKMIEKLRIILQKHK